MMLIIAHATLPSGLPRIAAASATLTCMRRVDMSLRAGPVTPHAACLISRATATLMIFMLRAMLLIRHCCHQFICLRC